MGCFNAACSASNLSIGHGDKVVFIPLVPGHSYDSDLGLLPYRKIEPAHMLTYSNCFYNPFSFPIEGEYNDYGSLEKIKKDHNTAAIEKFFGIKIGEFMDCVTSGREWYCYMSGVHETYAEKPRLLREYSVHLNEKFLRDLGFKRQPKSTAYVYQNEKVKRLLEVYLVEPEEKKRRNADGYGFKILDDKGVELYKSDEYDAKEKLHKAFQKLTGWYLGIRDADQARVKIISDLSGMFVLKDIYDDMTKNNKSDNWGKDRGAGTAYTSYITKTALEELGFKPGKRIDDPKYAHDKRFKDKKATLYSKEGSEATVSFEDRGAVIKLGKKTETSYTLENFDRDWKALTGEQLNFEPFKLIYTSDLDFEEYRNSASQEAVLRDQMKEVEKKEQENKKLSKEEESLFSRLWRLSDYARKQDGFGGAFKDWDHFSELYDETIKAGHLKEEIRWFRMFQCSFYSCNRFFFPAMNGEQHGNTEESMNLLEASIKVLKKRIKEREEWDAPESEQSL